MNNEKENPSLHFQAGSRTYFFDIRETVNESKYLKITESKATEGIYVRHSIMIFEEDIENFRHAVSNAIHLMQSPPPAESTSKMQQSKAKFKNAYQKWTGEKDMKLTKWFCLGMKTSEIAKRLERKPGAITSRIKKLELREKYGD